MGAAMTDRDESTALTREDIADGGPFDPVVARTLLDLGLLAVEDLLDAKKQFEVKAIALQAAFIPGAVAALGAPIVAKLDYGAVWLFSGLLFTFATVGCVFTLRGRKYGAAGIDPRPWLNERWLSRQHSAAPDGEKAARLHAMLAYDIGSQVELSERANSDKANLIRNSTMVGIFATISALIATGLEVWF